MRARMSSSKFRTARQRWKRGGSRTVVSLPKIGAPVPKSHCNAVRKKGGPGVQSIEPYSPLNQHTDEIRLLVLHPGTGKDQVKCALETYQLAGCREFEALSYAWGNPLPVEPILINGARTLITHNLSIALRHLRFAKSCRRLWVDAVCINQTDVGERNHQVFMMNGIYSAARVVLVWLGEERDQSNIAMARLRELADEHQVTTGEELSSMRVIFDGVLNRDWWGRLWVVQEVVLAKAEPLILCGSSSMPWNIFMKGFRAGGFDEIATSELLEIGVERISQCDRLHHLREYYRSQIDLNAHGSIGLGKLLNYTKDFHATDPRDKIYACLGLLSAEERQALKPDYQKQTDLVFLETSKQLLDHGRGVYFSRFSFSSIRSELSRASPSWVPDFSTQKTLSFCNPELMTGQSPVYIPLSQETPRVSFQDNDKVLGIVGVQFDTVETVVQLKDNPLGQITQLERLTRLAVEKTIRADNLSLYASKLKKNEDIFDVLIGGRKALQELAPSFRDQYDALTNEAGMTSGTDCRRLLWLAKHILPGRCFFVTKMGFFGVAVVKVRENDSVTFLFGERSPIILRPRGLSFSIAGAAYFSGVMGDEVTGDMCSRGLVKERTFLIR